MNVNELANRIPLPYETGAQNKFIPAAPLPELPTEEEQQQDKANELFAEISPWLFDVTKDYPAPYCLLEYKGTGFSRLRNIQNITGQKKHGKTFVITILMAAILSKKNTLFPDLRVPQRTLEHLGHDPKVLYCDTEMEEADRALVQRRVHFICDWDFRTPNPNFNILSLTLCPREKRWDLIKKTIEYFKPDAVFIDGIRDLVTSINNEDTAVELTEEMMRVAAANKCCIWNALHENPIPNKRDSDGKMRGWLGTELGNKCSDTLVSTKEKDSNTLEVNFTVKQTDARGKDIEDFSFVVDGELAGKMGIPRIIEKPTTSSVKQHDIDDIKKWLNAGRNDIEWPASKTAIKGILKTHGNVTNSNEQTADIQAAINRRLLVEADNGRNPKFKLNDYDFPLE